MAKVKKREARPITIEAFRFVHLKSPEIYTGATQSRDFIAHPSPQDSNALVKTTKKNKKESFNPYSSLQDLKAVNVELYAFMFWLKNNRTKLDMDNLGVATKEVKPLSKEQSLKVWDNLFYQTQGDSSQALVEGLIRMLQANHFLIHYESALATYKETKIFPVEDLKKAAKASVIIPNELFQKDDTIGINIAASIDDKSKKILSNKLDIDVLKHRIGIYKKAIEAIKEAEIGYEKQGNVEYESAYKAYQIKVKELMESAQEITNEAGTITICGEEIHPFVFSPSNTWDDSYLKKVLSSEDLAVYQSFKQEEHLSFSETRTAIEKSLPDLYNQLFRKAKKNSSKTLIYKGISLPLRNRPLNNAFVFKAVEIDSVNNLYSIYVTQYFENLDTKVRKIKATINTSEKITASDTSLKPIGETDDYITMQLFPQGIKMSSFDVTFDVKGVFETENSDYSNSFEYKELRPGTLSSATTDPRIDKGKVPIPNIFGIMGVKIAEFKKVNQTLCCYTEGEVSHIENILAREYKERATRNLIRTELTTEEETERELEKLSDTTSTDRHEMQSEIATIMQQDKATSFAASTGAGGSYNFGTGSVNFNANISFNTSSSSSSSSNFSESESYAKELTQRAMKRLVEKTSYKRTAKMIREFEENNKHGFDNREGDKHVTGVYRWVDKIYKNELVNYGKRLMYEFMLPEPSRNYKHLLMTNLENSKVESCDTMALEMPIAPDDENTFDISSFEDIDENNFAKLAAYYGVEVEDYPVSKRRLAKSFSENFYHSGSRDGDGKPWHVSKDFKFELPEGYDCVDFKCWFVAKRHGVYEDIYGDLLIGNRSQAFNSENATEFNGNVNIQIPFFPPIIRTFDPVEGHLPIAVAATDVGPFAMTIWADCELKQEVLDDWKAKFFSAIWKSYQEMLQKYNDALYEQCLNKKQDELASNGQDKPNYNIHPLMARSIEKREIKRLIIELILQKVYSTIYPLPYPGPQIPIGYNNYIADPCNNTLNINTSSGFYKDHIRFAKFLEHAFEWEIMAYTFLPYYWADENEWGNLLSIDSAADHIFLAFLQSGLANIILPVKPGLEKSVAFLLETGKLWNGDGFVLDGQDDLYPGIDENMQIEVDENGNEVVYDPKGTPIPVVEATWETRVPSTLTIVQDYNNPLAEEGLPCFCKEDGESVIGYSEDGNYNTLKGKDE